MVAKVIIVDDGDNQLVVDKVKRLFSEIDAKFSMYKPSSIINAYNRKEIETSADPELEQILAACEKTKRETNGYFDCRYDKNIDPSGLVKGYAISRGAAILRQAHKHNFLVEIAGDVQTSGSNSEGEAWQVGIENPFCPGEVVKIVRLSGEGIATSGTAVHPDHIINPLTHEVADEIASISVVTADVYDADRMATAAFAMGKKGIEFIQSLAGYGGYMIKKDQIAVMSEGFKKYV